MVRKCYSYYLIFDFLHDFFLCTKKDQPKDISPQLAEWLLSTRFFAWLFAPKAEPYYCGESDKKKFLVPMFDRSTSLTGESILRRKAFNTNLNYTVIYKRPEVDRVATTEQTKFRYSYCKKINRKTFRLNWPNGY